MNSSLRVAIAHDYLTQRGGAERVVLALARAFPGAPIYTTLFSPQDTYPEFSELDVRTSWLNHLAIFRRHHRYALPLLPLASQSMHIEADVVIASSSGWAHGFRTGGKKLVYCYSPPRWLYEPDRYLGQNSSNFVVASLRTISPSLRLWDRRASESADRYLAISSVTQDRIRRTYRLDAEIVPAPHSVGISSQADEERTPRLPAPGYFLTISRLLPYKNIDKIVMAASLRPEDRFVIVGGGPQKPELSAMAPPNVTFLENLSDSEMFAVYEDCVALIAASHEDFGLTPIEAAAHGKPSAVLRWGGFLDTVVEGETGIFFDEPDPQSINDSLNVLQGKKWSVQRLRDSAEAFSEENFAGKIRHHVMDLAQS